MWGPETNIKGPKGDKGDQGDPGVGGSPSTTPPLMDITPEVIGTSMLFAREDHRHPVDTSRAAVVHTHLWADITDKPSTFAPSAHTHTAGSITSGAALTEVDDTNVTMTLGGTPAAALLQGVSMTLGWTGTLSVARGGNGTATGISAAAQTALDGKLNDTTDTMTGSLTVAGTGLFGSTAALADKLGIRSDTAANTTLGFYQGGVQQWSLGMLSGSSILRFIAGALPGASVATLSSGGDFAMNGALTVTGYATAQTPPAADNSTKVATTAWVQSNVVPLYAPIPSGRLSLSGTAAKPAADVTGASAATLWYVDCGGGFIPIWDNTSSTFKLRPFTGALSLPLDPDSAHTNGYHQAGGLFDVYAFWDSALGQIRIGTTFQATPNFANRGSAINGLTQKLGIWVSSLNGHLRVTNTGNVLGTDTKQPGTNQATYLGSVCMAANGQCEDSKLRRYVYNAYNTVERIAWKKFTGSNYEYHTATSRQVNGDATNKVAVVIGLPGTVVRVRAAHFAVCNAVAAVFYCTVGEGSITPIPETEATGGVYGRSLDTSGGWPATFTATLEPGIGLREYWWLEQGIGGANTVTWQADSLSFRNGIFAEMAI